MSAYKPVSIEEVRKALSILYRYLDELEGKIPDTPAAPPRKIVPAVHEAPLPQCPKYANPDPPSGKAGQHYFDLCRQTGELPDDISNMSKAELSKEVDRLKALRKAEYGF